MTRIWALIFADEKGMFSLISDNQRPIQSWLRGAL